MNPIENMVVNAIKSKISEIKPAEIIAFAEDVFKKDLAELATSDLDANGVTDLTQVETDAKTAFAALADAASIVEKLHATAVKK
jgi:hypothetical protein